MCGRSGPHRAVLCAGGAAGAAVEDEACGGAGRRVSDRAADAPVARAAFRGRTFDGRF